MSQSNTWSHGNEVNGTLFGPQINQQSLLDQSHLLHVQQLAYVAELVLIAQV